MLQLLTTVNAPARTVAGHELTSFVDGFLLNEAHIVHKPYCEEVTVKVSFTDEDGAYYIAQLTNDIVDGWVLDSNESTFMVLPEDDQMLVAMWVAVNAAAIEDVEAEMVSLGGDTVLTLDDIIGRLF